MERSERGGGGQLQSGVGFRRQFHRRQGNRGPQFGVPVYIKELHIEALYAELLHQALLRRAQLQLGLPVVEGWDDGPFLRFLAGEEEG